VGPAHPGHAHPEVVAAIEAAAREGTSFGASTEREILLGEAIRAAVPSMERMRFVSSGTEATMSAVRLARGYTGRVGIVKIEGGLSRPCRHLAGRCRVRCGNPGPAWLQGRHRWRGPLTPSLSLQ